MLDIAYIQHGYGPKIPTPYKILYRGRWRRVYSACYGNSGSTYVIIDGVDTIVDIYFKENGTAQ